MNWMSKHVQKLEFSILINKPKHFQYTNLPCEQGCKYELNIPYLETVAFFVWSLLIFAETLTLCKWSWFARHVNASAAVPLTDFVLLTNALLNLRL